MATATKPRLTLGALTPLLDVNELDDAPVAPRSEEAPRMALDLIDEDPDQPRQEFNEETLQELADSIRTSGGVKSPVSLRPHPTQPGRYMLNFGARRLRASRMLGLPDIPYFIDRKVDSFDQVIENEQRQNLTNMEMAMFVKAQQDEGKTLKDIAERLGKNKGLISKFAALIDPPQAVMDAYRAGKVTGINEVYELRRLHNQHPLAVEQWIATQTEITRTALAGFRQQLETPVVQPEPAPAVEQAAQAEPLKPAARVETPDASVPAKAAPAPASASQTAKPAPAALALAYEYKGQPLVLDLTAKPPVDGHIYGRRPGIQRRLSVPIAEVRLAGFADE